ncbi:uncharacterized protein LOC101859848 [Aplysia californica]|uniref:Uncharacterized protein LOC101859848 n=1 Tax=Aplysia californica TaxID=6500 RepID=A0ABM0JL55_APLCA|nr:uncharacterized protein LOC101859848 [Aplysia californica]
MSMKVFLAALVTLAVPLVSGQLCTSLRSLVRVSKCTGCEHSNVLPFFENYLSGYARIEEVLVDQAATLPDEICTNSTLMEGAKLAIPCLYAELDQCWSFYSDTFPRQQGLLNFISDSCQLSDSDRLCFLAAARSSKVKQNCDNNIYGYEDECERWGNATSCIGKEVQSECGDSLLSFYNKHIPELSPVKCLPTSSPQSTPDFVIG